ncbi:macrolide-efflux protein [Mesobacillus boroniphilus JCM 21738]|uniref:Macrolide-efflux protein n=1 Tax=Mesobacillus boroniphilus JCM 21738 TaxID=1294265 RepID=W4RWR3_9BACI|nr:macrolide-efflux protein [Mesobacillus boroniphilus JCM 21738]
MVFAVLFLRSAVPRFFFPAEHGMVQGILKKEDYTTAAGLNQLVMSLFMLFGNGLGVLA